MRTVVVGNRKLARHLLRFMLQNGWNVVGAISPECSLATKQANFAPLEDVVEGTSCRLHRTTDINSDRTVDWISSVSPDYCISGGWSQIMEGSILEMPEQAFLGFHSSRLPVGRGGAPVNWSLIDGECEVWISLFHYTTDIDAGDVVARGSVTVERRDDVATVFDALAVEACNLMAGVRRDLESLELEAEPQSLTDATYRPRRQPQDGLINWSRDPSSQYDWVRAQTDPYPGAYTFHSGRKLTILLGEPIDLAVPTDVACGEILKVVPGEGVDVRSGDGVFRMTRVRLGNDPTRWADRYAIDAGISAGDRLGREFAPDSWLYTSIRGPDEPTNFETNLSEGESGRLDVTAYSGSNHELVKKVWLDDNLIFEKSVVVNPASRERVVYQPGEPGSHTLRIEFKTGGKRVDTRHIKVFVH